MPEPDTLLAVVGSHTSGYFRPDDLTADIVAFVASWIQDYGPYDDDGEMERAWKREMSTVEPE